MRFPPPDAPGRGARGRQPSYRRHDLVRCDACAHVFLAQGKSVFCPRCKGALLTALRR